MIKYIKYEKIIVLLIRSVICLTICKKVTAEHFEMCVNYVNEIQEGINVPVYFLRK